MMPPAPAPIAAPVPLSVAHPALAIMDAPRTMEINFVIISSPGAVHMPDGACPCSYEGMASARFDRAMTVRSHLDETSAMALLAIAGCAHPIGTRAMQARRRPSPRTGRIE